MGVLARRQNLLDLPGIEPKFLRRLAGRLLTPPDISLYMNKV
jgi:hypothetical protein